MSNSPLISYTRLSPNHSGKRKYKTTKITPHHTASVISVEAMGQLFASPARQASSNYGVGSDARIALYVDEANRAWTSANADNDNRAVTIEVSNSKTGGDWPVSDKCFDSLVALCTDICKRNGMTRLTWTGDKSGTVTSHDMFVSTTCMGPYLKSKMPELVSRVNSALSGTAETPKVPSAPSIPSGSSGTGFGGKYTCKASKANVRNAPSLSGSVIAYYVKGQSVTLDDWYVSADGYIWGRYTGANSGQKRYIAIGKATGKAEADDIWIKQGTSTASYVDLGDTSCWGPKFTHELQTQLGTTVDGVISGQSSANKKYHGGISGTFQYGSGGSRCIIALQRKLKAAGYSLTVDGHYGPKTIKAHQQWLIKLGWSCGKSGADGYHGKDTSSAMAKALQAGAYK